MNLILAALVKHTPRVLIYGVVIIGAAFLLYSAFLKPTTTKKTNNNSGSKQSYILEGAKVTTFGCATFGERYKNNE